MKISSEKSILFLAICSFWTLAASDEKRIRRLETDPNATLTSNYFNFLPDDIVKEIAVSLVKSTPKKCSSDEPWRTPKVLYNLRPLLLTCKRLNRICRDAVRNDDRVIECVAKAQMIDTFNAAIKLDARGWIDRQVTKNSKFKRHLLELATMYRKPEMIMFLLNTYDIDLTTTNSAEILGFAISSNYDHIVSTVLKKGAPADARNIDQDTPLHIAARLNNSNIAELLLQHGADINAKNRKKQTPLQVAKQSRATETEKLLLKAWLK